MKFFNLNIPSTNFKSKLLTILLGYIVMFIYMVSISHLLVWLYPPPPGYVSVPDSNPEPLAYTIFITILWAPFWEEILNRHAYGLIVKQIGNQFLLPAMLISSFVFGWLHGNGQISVLRQGVSGMIFFYVYAKNSYSWRSSFILHMLWNTTVTFSPDWIW
jgi:membrane protease YdiL (CAAX protease family)